MKLPRMMTIALLCEDRSHVNVNSLQIIIAYVLYREMFCWRKTNLFEDIRISIAENATLKFTVIVELISSCTHSQD